MSNPARAAITAAATNSSRTRSMSARVMGRARWLRSDQATGDGAMTGQLPAFSVGLDVNEIDDTGPRPFMLGRIHPGTAGCDPPLGAHTSHLGADQSCTAFGAFAVMHEMPIGRAALDRLVLRHRRHHDAVLQPHLAQAKWREHRTADLVVAGAGKALKPGFGALQPIAIAQPQVLVADALRARQQRIIELHWIEVEVTLDILEPFKRIACRGL